MGAGQSNENINKEIKKICDSPGQDFITILPDSSTVNNVINKKLQDNYNAIVEKGNNYPKELLLEESKYFTKKYGNDVYEKLLDKRISYIKPPSPPPPDLIRPLILDQIHVLNQSKTTNSNAVNILNTYLPSFDSNTIYREIEYRDNEYIRLYQINFILNILYYVGLIILLSLLFSSNNLLLKERFLFYLFLALLPFLYPWIFLFSRKIFNKIYPSISYNGPVNAFIDTNKTTTTMWSNNTKNNYQSQTNTTTLS